MGARCPVPHGPQELLQRPVAQEVHPLPGEGEVHAPGGFLLGVAGLSRSTFPRARAPGLQGDPSLLHQLLHEVVQEGRDLLLELRVALALGLELPEHLGGELSGVQEGVQEGLLQRLLRPGVVGARPSPEGVVVGPPCKAPVQEEIGEVLQEGLQVQAVQEAAPELRVGREAHGGYLGQMETRSEWSLVDRQDIRRALLAFFDEERRSLPWRGSEDPYPIWVSEVMSQQTRMGTVVPYYRAWMAQFPDVESLAEASEEEVLRAWQGLGYYSRARNLHRAARLVVREHGGELPRTVEGLRGLPGVGPYTAGAVASIALGEPVPAVDGNVRRVLARLLDDPDPTPRELERRAAELVDPERPGDFNQGLMELGSRVCTPRSPDCGVCPVSVHCLALARGTREERPRPRKRKAVPHLVEAVAVLRRREDGAILLRRRPPEGLLGGMWECPGIEVARDAPKDPSARRIRDGVEEVLRGLEKLGVAGVGTEGAGLGELLPAVDHVFSHRKVTYRGILLDVPGVGRGKAEGRKTGSAPSGGSTANAPEDICWADEEALEALPLPVAQQAILDRARTAALARREGDA
ncbi:MAG: A/G-specific adenine glycosylase [Gemmatimonadales bacterium]|nr:MAG: A/G-specific adenine glycosylase [Gemmatimonadales bacterium]